MTSVTNGQSKNDTGQVTSSRWKAVGVVPVFGFLILLAGLYIHGDTRSFESPDLLAIMNTIFLCAIPLAGAYFATKSYRATGVLAFLLVGCGMAFFGFSSFFAGWVMPLAGGPNPTVTLHNLGCLFAGIGLSASAHLIIQESLGARSSRKLIPHLGLLYAGIFLVISVVAVLAFRGDLPLFFSAQTGATSLRQLVLGAAILLIAAAGLAFLETYLLIKSEFAMWFGLGLWLVAIGLTCVLLQHRVGSVLGWAGRGAQYLGCIYFVIAYYVAQRERTAFGLAEARLPAWSLWPYLEQRVSERTSELNQLNAALQSEVDERKLAQSALLESENFYHSLIDNLLEGYAYCRMLYLDGEPWDFEYLMVNTAFEKLTGLQNVTGKKVSEVIPGIRESDPELFSIYTQVAQTGKSDHAEFFLKSLNIWLSLFIYKPKKDEFIVIFTNITERKQYEHILKEQSEFLRQVINTMGQGLLVTDADGHFEMLNPALAEITGWPAEELIGKTVSEVIYVEDLVLAGQAQAERLPGETSSYEAKCVRADGSMLPVLVTVSPHIKEAHYAGSIAVITDLSAIKLAEQLRLETEIRYNKAFRSSPLGILIFNLADGRSLDANDAYLKMIGYSRQEILGHTAAELNILVEYGERAAWMEILRKEGRVENQETRIRAKNGEIHHALFSVEAYEMQGEQFAMVLSFDISERKQAEMALRQSEERLRQVLESSLDASYKRNLKTNEYDYLSPVFYSLTGYSQGELNKLPVEAVLNLINPADQVEVDRVIGLSMSGDSGLSYEVEYRFRHKNGSYRWFQDRFTFLRDETGAPLARIGSVSDITERKQAQEEVATLALRNQTLLNTATDGIHVLDDQGNFVDANPAFCAMLGYSREELMVMDVSAWDSQWTPDKLVEMVRDFIDHPGMFEMHHRRKDGVVLDVEINAVGVTLEGRKYLYAASRDITERKRAEVVLIEAHAELEQRVLERTAELRKTNIALEAASRAKDEFLAMMSHELRTPLTGIIGLAQVLQLKSYGELNDKQLKAIQNVELSGHRLNRLLESILNYSSLQSGKRALHFRELPLQDICQGSLSRFEKLAADKQQTLRFSIIPDSILVNADEAGMHQILDHLLGNALKFTPEGGSIDLNVVCLPGDAQVIISVRDTGIGIQEKDLPRLFEPFLQLDSSLSRNYEGAGMGLALVNLLVKLHGGSLKVESVFGQGSLFTVCLPWQA